MFFPSPPSLLSSPLCAFVSVPSLVSRIRGYSRWSPLSVPSVSRERTSVFVLPLSFPFFAFFSPLSVRFRPSLITVRLRCHTFWRVSMHSERIERKNERFRSLPFVFVFSFTLFPLLNSFSVLFSLLCANKFTADGRLYSFFERIERKNDRFRHLLCFPFFVCFSRTFSVRR